MGTRNPNLGRGPGPQPARHPEGARAEKEAGGLASTLFTKTQQRVLGLLFGQPERAFYLSELIDLAGTGTGAVQRELGRLVDGGLVSVLARDGRKAYKANEASPIFGELCSIVEKTSGVAEQLRRALAPCAKAIVAAILYGSVAKETDKADSDIDILIVSDTLVLEDVYRALGPLEQRLGRHVSPTLYTVAEIEARLRGNNPFVTKVLSGKHRVLLGELYGHSAA